MFILKKTSSYCPEQYDAYLNGQQVGYLRLRHGRFTVEFPKCGGEFIYSAAPKGDGIFEDDEREHYLTEACFAIQKRIDGHRRKKRKNSGTYKIE